MKTNRKMNIHSNVWALIVCALIVLLLCSFIFAPKDVALADWTDDYDTYLGGLDTADSKDWYFGEDHLDVEGALALINQYLSNPDFDKEGLKADPIIIAVIDSGIGYAYTTDGETETPAKPENIYDEGTEYRLHDVFKDVLLTAENGNYIYKNFAKETAIINDSTNSTIVSLTAPDSDNIACDLVDNTSDDHGTHVTGMVAMLIHKLGLEDYVKILPVKANVTLRHGNIGSNEFYRAGYKIDVLTDAMEYCYDQGADIVSLSLTGYKNSFGIIDSGYKLSAFTDRMTVVAAAGNSKGKKEGYPAAVDNVIGVVNYDSDGELASSSNYGEWYNIATPGTDIISSINGEEFGKLTGTSMATPITAFGCALAQFAYTGFNGARLDIDEMCGMLTSGATRYVEKGYYVYPALSLSNVLTNAVGITPSSVDIETFVCDEYDIGGVEVVTLTATPCPFGASREDNLRWWYEYNGEEYAIGDGWEVEFSIPERVGNYVIKCAVVDENGEKYAYCNKPISFDVTYRLISELEIRADYDAYLVGETFVFVIPTEYVNPITNVNVVWYVNGKRAGEGRDFEFTPEELGTYVITAEVNGAVVDTIEITTYTDDGWLLFFVMLLFLGVTLETVRGAVIAIIVKISIDLVACAVILTCGLVKNRKKQ